MAKGFTFAKDYTKALILLAVSLTVLWFFLNFIHQRFGGNVFGQFAGTVGEYATGQKYQF